VAGTLDVAKLNQPSISLTTHLGIFEDVDKKLTLEDIQKDGIQFKTDLPESESINKSFTKSAFWLRFDIENSSDSQIEKIIEIDYPLLRYVDFYFQSDYKNYQIHTGYGRPYENRAYKSQIFAFPLQLQAHSQNTIYIRIEESPNTIDIPVNLWEPEFFQLKERGLYGFQSFYLGIVVAVSVFSIALTLLLKEKTYLIYISMIFFLVLTNIAFKGLGSEYIWKDYPLLTQIGPINFGAFSTALQLIFLHQVLKKVTLRFIWILKSLIFAQILIPLIVISDIYLAKYCLFILVVSILFSLFVSVIGVIHKERSSYFLCAGFSVMCIGGITMILYMFALLPTNFLISNSLSISSSIEMLIFILLLTDRYNFIHIDKLQGDKHLAETNQSLLAEIEERKKGEKRQVALMHQLNHMQKLESIGRLTSGIAHDFNNILMAISGYNDLNKNSAQDLSKSTTANLNDIEDDLMGNSKQIEIACRKATKLISQMLSYCRRDQSELIENPVFNVNNELHESIDMLRKIIPSTIKFELNQSDKIIPLKQLDEANFNQIIVNLCVNASHAMADSKGTIKFYTGQAQLNSVCSCCMESFNGKFVEISVSDNGSGIDPIVAKRIFEPFYTTKEVGEGTGLGLSVIAGLVHNAGGHILLESEMGVGTTFRLLFPYQ
jgi:signal transduction histidine kinase